MKFSQGQLPISNSQEGRPFFLLHTYISRIYFLEYKVFVSKDLGWCTLFSQDLLQYFAHSRLSVFVVRDDRIKCKFWGMDRLTQLRVPTKTDYLKPYTPLSLISCHKWQNCFLHLLLIFRFIVRGLHQNQYEMQFLK